METKEYIESGILELYVYGLLDETQNLEVAQMAKDHPEVERQIVSIEKAIVNLSTSFSPYLTSDMFMKIRAKLMLKYGKVVDMKPKSNVLMYVGWAAVVLLMLGIGYQYSMINEKKVQLAGMENEKSQMQETLVASEIKHKQTKDALTVVRDIKNTVVSLSGQAVAPNSYARVYWNNETKAVHIDAAGLPTPPQGMVYQIWSLKMNPLTPTSIGLLDNFTAENNRIFTVNETNGAEGFGITLEPAGGSATPTMTRLYTLGVVKV